jgi:hypothetical protein
MRRYRKALVIVTAIAMVLGSMGMAFAQTTTTTTTTSTSSSGALSFSDVNSSTPHYASIMDLAALGVVHGYPNGTFDPTGDITRAEFATMIDAATGLASAAALEQNTPSKYSDVPVGQWYTGDVNVATAQGYFHGYPNGTFQPNANITYDEVLTVLVNALGYGPAVTGAWPAGDVAAAATLGLMSGVTITDGSAPATRGDVAKLVNTSLNTKTWSMVSGSLQQGANTLAYNDLKYQYNNVSSTTPDTGVVVATPGTNPSAGSNAIKVTTWSSATSSYSAATYTVASNAEIMGASSLDSLIGEQIDYILNTNNNQILAINVVTTPAETVTGATYNSYSGTTINVTLSGATTTSNLTATPAAGLPVVDVGGTLTTGSAAPGMSAGDTINVYEDSAGNVIGIIDTSVGQFTVNNAVITAIGTNTISYEYVSTTNVLTPGANIPVSSSAVVTLNGSASSLSSLAVGDVANIDVVNGSATDIAAFNKNTTGTISGISENSAGTVTGVTVNGTTISVDSNGIISINGTMYPGYGFGSTANSLFGSSATIDYDAGGTNAAYINATSTSTPSGILQGPIYGTSTSISVDVKGTVNSYTLAPGATFNGVSIPGAIAALAINGVSTIGDPMVSVNSGSPTQAYDFVKLTLNLNGQVTAISDLNYNATWGYDATVSPYSAVSGLAQLPNVQVNTTAGTLTSNNQNSNTSTVVTGTSSGTANANGSAQYPQTTGAAGGTGQTWNVSSTTPIYNMSGAPQSTLSGLSALVNGETVEVVPGATPGYAAAVLVTQGVSSFATGVVTGSSTSYSTGSNGSPQATTQLTMDVAGTSNTYTVPSTLSPPSGYNTKGAVVKLTLSGTSVTDVAEPTGINSVIAYVYNLQTVNGVTEFELGNNATPADVTQVLAGDAWVTPTTLPTAPNYSEFYLTGTTVVWDETVGAISTTADIQTGKQVWVWGALAGSSSLNYNANDIQVGSTLIP